MDGPPRPRAADEFRARVMADVAATAHVATVVLGEKLGLWSALAQAPGTADELAQRVGCDPGYVREWLLAQCASGYCDRGVDGRFMLSPAQVAVLAGSASPPGLTGAAAVASVLHKDEDLAVDAFRTGRGVAWFEHDDDLFGGTDRMSQPTYATHLVEDWLPALDGVVGGLEKGISVADIGCGLGSAVILLAQAYPNSTFIGFDNHRPSVERARRRAAEAGVGDRVRFETTAANGYPGRFELVCAFDTLHEMGDPTGVARHIRRSLTGDGTFLLVEPVPGGDAGNRGSPSARFLRALSVFVCFPHARSEHGPHELGNQVPDAVWERLLGEAGFSRFRRAAETSCTRVFEARP